MGYKEPKNLNLVYGFVHDDAVNFNYAHKVTAEKDLPKGDVQDYFRSSFDTAKDTVLDWEGEDPGAVRESGIKGIDIFYDSVMKEVRPEQVQPKLEMGFKDSGIKLVGRPDFLEKNGTIGDNKTSRAAKQAAFITQATQPVFYSVLKDGLNEGAREVRFDVLVRTKIPKIQQMKVVIDQGYRIAALKVMSSLVQKVNSQLEAKNFPPTAFFRKSWECDYCPVKDLCRKVWGLPVGESKLEVILSNKDESKKASAGNDAVIEKLKKIKEQNDSLTEKVVSEIKTVDLNFIKRNLLV